MAAPAVNLDTLAELSTVEETAAFLRCSTDTVLARIVAEALPSVRAGDGPRGYWLVPKASIAALLAERAARLAAEPERAKARRVRRLSLHTGPALRA